MVMVKKKMSRHAKFREGSFSELLYIRMGVYFG